jgi:glycosyltransferase involved in cell wall biosynthesis
MLSVVLHPSPYKRAPVKIDLYAHCWNEERIIPFFLRHYEPLVERMVIFDNGSTDRSRELFQQSAKVELRHFDSGDSFNLMNLVEASRCWKESRGCADWVIIADIDEFIYHPSLRDYLGQCQKDDVTILHPIGMGMVSADFPDQASDLTNAVRRGVPQPWMDKSAVFNPDAIDEINYEVGRHAASPTGRAAFPPAREVKLLHYKNLGLDYLVARTSEMRGRKTAMDREKGWGFHLDRSAEQLRTDLEQMLSEAQEVI